MTKLKTLKDLKVVMITKYYPDKELMNLVPTYDLKQEAIKDIKLFSNPKYHFSEICGYNKKERNAIINYIKFKFNIKEVDLSTNETQTN